MDFTGSVVIYLLSTGNISAVYKLIKWLGQSGTQNRPNLDYSVSIESSSFLEFFLSFSKHIFECINKFYLNILKQSGSYWANFWKTGFKKASTDDGDYTNSCLNKGRRENTIFIINICN